LEQDLRLEGLQSKMKVANAEYLEAVEIAGSSRFPLSLFPFSLRLSRSEEGV